MYVCVMCGVCVYVCIMCVYVCVAQTVHASWPAETDTTECYTVMRRYGQ